MFPIIGILVEKLDQLSHTQRWSALLEISCIMELNNLQRHITMAAIKGAISTLSVKSYV